MVAVLDVHRDVSAQACQTAPLEAKVPQVHQNHIVVRPRSGKTRLLYTRGLWEAPKQQTVSVHRELPWGWVHNGKSDMHAIVTFLAERGIIQGDATDDCRWATAVCKQADTILCSVDYRRAPEHPFPTAVEDGADAIMYIFDNAKSLGIDKDKIGVSGFSAGGNMAFTTTLRLQDALLRRRGAEPPTVSSDAPVVLEHEHRIVKVIIGWYPSTDFTRPRDERRKTNIRPDKELPRFFTKLFDLSYLHPPKEVKLDSPYLSPGVASDDLLSFLPEEILMYCCEWDELRAEGERFRDRIRGLGKTVHFKLIEGVPHGWDKAPNPFHEDEKAKELYQEACGHIKRVFFGQ